MNENTPATETVNRTDATMRGTIAHLVELKRITPEQGESVFWLHGYAMSHGLSNRELAARVGVSSTAVSLIFSGKYDAGDWAPMIRRIDAFRKSDTRDVRRVDVGFVECDTAKTIFGICDNAYLDHMPAFVYGASQLGKTRALEEYVRRHNTQSIKYIRCLAGMTRNSFARLVAKKCHLRGLRDKVGTELLVEVAESLNSNSLLIFDEFHLCMETVRRETSKTLVESIRQIYDLSKCGLVICSTKVGLADLEEGPNRMLFDQLRRRGIIKAVLPDVPSIADINAFSRAYGLPAPHGETLAYIKNLLQLRGLGVFCGYLNKASARIATINRKAEDDGKEAVALTWDYFLEVARGFEAMANIRADY